ncbi:AAA family ATPase [Candidatus Pacearchaeota archaeon CG10_big_fil_rev_8_21_14_0_10_30_48]|nr:MAG: AAA family ATPase [Candidatus Pacearchaeota archaeon CG10_big_fil_rev_8_21_14_0_10_30_48]
MEGVKTEEFLVEAKNFFLSQKKEIGKAARSSEGVVLVGFEDLAEHSPQISELLLEKPEEVLTYLEMALAETGLVKNPKIRLLGLPKNNFIKIRNIRAKHLNHFIWVEGIVRQASEVRPQVVSAKFECPSCGTIISVLQLEKKFKEPSRCSCGRKGFFKLLLKQMIDAQRLVVEESPEALVGGEQPRRINVFLKEDLVDPKMEERTTPGSKIKIFGILNEVPVPLPTGVSTRFDLAIDANNVIPMEESYEALEISEEDELQIKELSVDPQVFDKLADTIAPSIYGYKEIKESLVLQLFGGVRKEKSDGTMKRGDIHILLVGDPGVAKSVTLTFISMIAPKGRYVVGKSASGAGLTATVVRDEFLKGWSLEAGAMVLSNKGIVCIDEIEKMDPQDRSAMHEAMEQQTVTISKANVQASLRAETSVLAAGNPKFGRFDPYQPLASQVDIQPTLLNRFDVIFMLRDIPDRSQDDAIATHVLSEHKHLGTRGALDPYLFRKYIAYAKQRIKPKLTDEAIDEIKNFYVSLRNMPVAGGEMDIKPIPITARQLEALVRLSEASAKSRLSEKVEKRDSERAIKLMKYYLLQAGFDQDTKSFDIDKIVTGVTASRRGKIMELKEAIISLENRIGKMIPVEELEKELQGKMEKTVFDDALDKLSMSGDIFKPKKGYIQRVN